MTGEAISRAIERLEGAFPSARRERVLTIVLGCVLLVSLVSVVFIATNPAEQSTPFTEFYILGTGGNASDYPTNLTVDETGTVTVGVANREGQRLSYTVVARLDDRTVATRSVTLADDEVREWPISVTPQSPGTHRLRLLLFKGERVSGTPDQDLRLWLNATNPSP